MLSPFGSHLIRKRLAIWLALGCLLVLVTVVTRGFRFNRSSSIGFAPQLPGHFIGVPIGDQAEKESTTVDQSIETDSPKADHSVVDAAGVNPERLARARLGHSRSEQAVTGGKSLANADGDAALLASVERLERRVAAAIGRARESVVALEYTAVDAPPGSRRGATGVVINNRGEVLSVRIDPPAASPTPVMGEARARIVARDFEGRRHSTHWIAADAETGLTLLRLPPRAVRPIRAATNGPNLGSQVFVVGNPFGMGHSVSRGHVAALERVLELGARQLGGLIQIQAPLYPGDSGGAVVNLQGDWLGLIRSGLARQGPESAAESSAGAADPHARSTAYPSPALGPIDFTLFRPERDTDFGFAIPARDALWVADQLRAQGRVDRAYLGVRLEPVSAVNGRTNSSEPEVSRQASSTATRPQSRPTTATGYPHETDQAHIPAEEGAFLREVLPGTPAAEAGLRPGDGIITLNEHRIRTAHDLTDRLDRIPARTTIHLGVVRGRGPERQWMSTSLRTANRPQVAQLAGPELAPATPPRSSLADAPTSLAATSAGLRTAIADQPLKSEVNSQARAVLSRPQPDEPHLSLPRAVVDRLERLERRLEKLEAFPAHPTSPATAPDRQISAARTP